ncbi:hypothetical protein [Stieleria mannarensis]|uniref:hypothetical protein n=1 Tax=Stieleria mannarensis TaxID=2755585 RepID=UPI0016030E58|nr:hypothetical protein [Rhodopirellula sp. JC639]
MTFEYLHEQEVVAFRSSTRRPLAELLPTFTSQGFALHDDTVSLDRSDNVPPWQHPSIVEVECQLDGDEVFGFDEGEWDTLLMKYLFASVPFEFVDQFVDVVITTGRLLGIEPKFHGNPVSGESLKEKFERIREQLLSETGELAGSEQLAIIIQSTYPR